MSVEVLPLGVACNIACRFCYQETMRDAGNVAPPHPYSMEKMLAGLAAENPQHFTVFGGEPLLVPLEDLEKLWAFGLTLPAKQNSIQTNATLITEEHIEAFKKYRVGIGISLDGPGELNDARWAGTLEKTRTATERSQKALERCLEEGLSVGLIVTLTTENARPDRLPRMLDWFRKLDRLGVRHINLHFLEVDTPAAADLRLDPDDLTAAALAIGDLMESTSLTVDPIATMTKLLLGDDRNANCVWWPCDPYTTSGVHGILGDGTRVNCGRIHSNDGIPWEKAGQRSYVRQQALWQTPMDRGGCQGCKFFFACKGNCPGEGEGDNWQNKTEHCGTLYAIFEHLEARQRQMGLRPISADPARRERLTQNLLAYWAQGQSVPLSTAEQGPPGQAPAAASTHGDHKDHRDRPHGDHYDAGGA